MPFYNTMTNKERQAIKAIYDALDIPKPAGAIQTASIQGYADFSRDVVRVQDPIRAILYQMGCGETYPGSLAEDIENLRKINNSKGVY